MAKKRKSLATSLDEVDRTMYSTFSSAANSLSQLYTQAMNQQKLSFLSGERHGLEKLFQWISRQHGAGVRVTTNDILAYIQTELDTCVEEPSSPAMTAIQNNQNQLSQAMMQQFTNSSSSPAPSSGHGSRSEHSDPQQSKNYVFSHALSSPVRRSLQNYHISPESYNPNGVQPSAAAGIRNGEPSFAQQQNRDSNRFNSGDSSMDHESRY